jgi:crossover junction endonuclease EME1
VLVIVTAEEVVDKIAMGGRLLSGWAVDVRLALGINDTDQMIVMITGLQKYYSKSKSLANRAFTAAVRAGLGEGTKSSQPGMALRISKEVIERELVKLQVVEGCFLVHGAFDNTAGLMLVEKTEDVEDWVYNLAADIAIRPVRPSSRPD